MAKSTKGKSGNSKAKASKASDANAMPDDNQADAEKPIVLEDMVEGSVDADDAEAELGDDLSMEVVDDTPAAEDSVTEAHEDINAEDAVDQDTDSSAPAPERSNASGSGGFIALLLGGVAAGAIGYGVAAYYPMRGASDDLASQVSAQADQIAALEARLADAPTVDLSGVEAQIAALSEQMASQTQEVSATLETGLSDLDARLTEVEKQPNADGTLSDTALAAYQRELEELRAELDAQQENVMSAAAQAEADLAAARAEAEALEQEALAAAQAAASRAALNRVKTAVDTGAPFADALGDLDGELPAALTSAADTGVATNAQLAEDFPAAARNALATARSEGVSGESGGVGAFLRNQFDVRSTTPQEGSTPDAILSRAEAAVKEGRVADALAEIDALPEVVRAELTDWTANATQRAEVLDAIATLSETFN